MYIICMSLTLDVQNYRRLKSRRLVGQMEVNVKERDADSLSFTLGFMLSSTLFQDVVRPNYATKHKKKRPLLFIYSK